MLPYLTERFGNPSGSHAVARAARQAVDDARDEVAAALGCEPGEVVFTAGGTEADNLAVLGAHAVAGGSVVCSAVEHDAVLLACRAVGGTTIAVDASGTVDLDALFDALHPGVGVVSVMLVNNEVGTIQPVAEVAALVRERAPGAVVHTDAVAAVPWLDVAVMARAADLVSVSAHKFGGPKGVGVLVVRGGTPPRPRPPRRCAGARPASGDPRRRRHRRDRGGADGGGGGPPHRDPPGAGAARPSGRRARRRRRRPGGDGAVVGRAGRPRRQGGRELPRARARRGPGGAVAPGRRRRRLRLGRGRLRQRCGRAEPRPPGPRSRRGRGPHGACASRSGRRRRTPTSTPPWP